MASRHAVPDMMGDWDSMDGDTVAQLEAEQERLAEQLAALRRDERAATSRPAMAPARSSRSEDLIDDDAGQALARENARLREQLAAMASASALKSTVKLREEEEAAALLKKYTEENAKLTAALATGAGLSELTAARPGASVVAASHARSARLVSWPSLDIAIIARSPSLGIRPGYPATGAGSAGFAAEAICVPTPSLLCRQAASPDQVSRPVACALSSGILRPERKGWTSAS